MERGASAPRARAWSDTPAPAGGRAHVESGAVPFSVADELAYHLDSPTEPWTVQVEVRTSAGLDPIRLQAAITEALARHPMARARQAPAAPWHVRLMWEIAPAANHDALRVVDCSDDAALAAARARFYSAPISLAASPPLRVQLVQERAGSRLMLSVHHAASDGLGSLRILVSIARAYAGAPDPVPDVDPLGVHDAGALFRDDRIPERIGRLLAFLNGARKVRARVAHEGGADRPGFGFHTVRLSAGDTAALVRARSGGATVNDLLLAALHLSIARWNAEHGVPCDRIAVMTPVNLRPRERWHEIVGNFSSFVTVTTRAADRATPARAVAAVAERTQRLKRGGAVGGVAEVLMATQPLQPLAMKRALWSLLSFAGNRVIDTAVLSNLGVLGETPDFGPDGGAITELWFSPPARMPLGVAVGTATLGGCLHVTLRYRHALFGHAAAVRFADQYLAALHSLS